jgi:hypothetical protein
MAIANSDSPTEHGADRKAKDTYIEERNARLSSHEPEDPHTMEILLGEHYHHHLRRRL